MSPLCSNCPKKNSCKELCQENEAFTNQDHVRRREKLLHDLQPDTQPEDWPGTGRTDEVVLKLYFVDRKTTKEIADIAIISQRYAQQIIKKYKPIIIENLKKSVRLRRK